MGLQITNRAITTHGSNSVAYLRDNCGQIAEEKIEFTCDYTFLSTSGMPTQIDTPTSLKLLGGNWSDFGFVIGDTVELTFYLSDGQGQSMTVNNASRTVVDVNADIITFDSSIAGISNEWIGSLSPQGSFNTIMKIVNVTRSMPEQIVFSHNLTLNSNQLSLGSLIDGTINIFEFSGVNSMSVNDTVVGVWLGNHSGGSYTSYTLTRLADASSLKKFRITMRYFLPDYDGGGRPSWFENNECLKSVYKIELISQINNPNGALTGSFSHILGNTGWYDEEHNGGVNNFQVQSVNIIANGSQVNTLDYSQTNNVSVVITGSNAVDTGVEVKFDLLPNDSNDYKNNQFSHLENRNTSYANTSPVYLAFGKNNAYFNIQNLVVTPVSASEIQVDFDIVPTNDFTQFVENLNSDDRNFLLSVTVRNGYDDCVSLIAIQNSLELAPIPNQPFNDYSELGFIEHYQILTDTHSVNLECRTEDDIIFHSIFDLDKNRNWEEMRLRVFVRRISDGLEFNLQNKTIPFNQFPIVGGIIQFNFTENIIQFLEAPDRNIVSLKLTGNSTVNDYEVELIWSLMNNWRYWIANNNAFLDFYDLTLPNNGRNDEWVRYLQLAGYEIYAEYMLVENGVGYVANSRLDIKDYDDWSGVSVINLYDDNNNQVNSLISGQTMRIEAIHTLNSGTWSGNVWGWISFRPHEAEANKRISTEWAWTSQSLPLRPLNGESEAKLTINGADAIVEALIDCSIINTDNVTLISRISGDVHIICKHPIEALFDAVIEREPVSGSYTGALFDILNGDYSPPLEGICCPDCDWFGIADYSVMILSDYEGCCVTDYDGDSQIPCGGDNVGNYNTEIDTILSLLGTAPTPNVSMRGMYNDGVNDATILREQIERLLLLTDVTEVTSIFNTILFEGVKFDCEKGFRFIL